MKKLSFFISMLVLVALMLPVLTASAASYPVMQFNPDINLEKKAPTLDGVISSGEGWCGKTMLDNMHVGGTSGNQPLTTETEIYFSYTDEGIYLGIKSHDEGGAYVVRFYDEEGEWAHGSFGYLDKNAGSYDQNNFPEKLPDGTPIEASLNAADGYNSIAVQRDPSIEHISNAFWYGSDGNTFEYCTGDGESEWTEYVYEEGDVFCLALDPTSYLWNQVANGTYKVNNNGVNDYTDDSSYDPTRDTRFIKPIMYNFAVYEGDEVKVSTAPRNGVSKADITSKCKGAAKLTKSDYCLEVMIPWDQIVEDANAVIKYHGMDGNITKEACLADGAQHKAAVYFLDRFMDEEAGYNDTWGRFGTSCDKCADGTEGGGSDGAASKTLGLTLKMPGAAASGGNGTTVTDASGKPVVTDASGKPVTGSKVTTKATSTGKPGQGGSGAQTFDAGIAVALGALATSAVGIYYSKKKR